MSGPYREQPVEMQVDRDIVAAPEPPSSAELHERLRDLAQRRRVAHDEWQRASAEAQRQKRAHDALEVELRDTFEAYDNAIREGR